jgi:hypothetical protein
LDEPLACDEIELPEKPPKEIGPLVKVQQIHNFRLLKAVSAMRTQHNFNHEEACSCSGYIPGLKKYVKAQSTTIKKTYLIDETFERTFNKRIRQTNKVLCFFPKQD